MSSRKQLEILLLDNVDNLGIIGDVVKVKAGYARNYLLPRGLATKPTPAAVEALAERRAEVEAELRRLREHQEQMIERLNGHELTLERSANEQGVLFGSVSQHDIAEALRGEGFEVEDRWVRAGAPIKRLDTYPVPVVVDKELKAEIKLWVVPDRPIEELEGEGEQGDGEGEPGEDEGPPVESGEAESNTASRGYRGANAS